MWEGCVYMPIEVRGQVKHLLLLLHLNFWERVSQWAWSHGTPWLADLLASELLGSTCVCCPLVGVTDIRHDVWLFHGWEEAKHKSLYLLGDIFWLSHLSSPMPVSCYWFSGISSGDCALWQSVLRVKTETEAITTKKGWAQTSALCHKERRGKMKTCQSLGRCWPPKVSSYSKILWIHIIEPHYEISTLLLSILRYLYFTY